MSTKRNFFKKLFTGSMAIFGSSSLVNAASTTSAPSKSGDFTHMVFIWLKEPENEEHRKTFLKNARTYLKKVEVVVTSYIGVPANTPREIVDNSYTFSLVVTFKNKEDQDIYQTHPAHVKFVEDTSDLWNKVQIYDSLKV